MLLRLTAVNIGNVVLLSTKGVGPTIAKFALYKGRVILMHFN